MSVNNLQSETCRPCIVKTTGEQAMFHRWVDGTSTTLALVEFADGNVAEVKPVNIQFLDSDTRWTKNETSRFNTAELDDTIREIVREVIKEEHEYEELRQFVYENI